MGKNGGGGRFRRKSAAPKLQHARSLQGNPHRRDTDREILWKRNRKSRGLVIDHFLGVISRRRPDQGSEVRGVKWGGRTNGN